MSLAIKEIINLSESQFLEKIESTMAETGNLGDVFPQMVVYNVPHYILRELWPERWEKFMSKPMFLSFVVAEKDWKGKIDNIASKVTETRGRHVLTFSKSYVLECETMLMVARFEDDFVLCWVPADKDEVNQDWKSRDEADIKFKSSSGVIYDHYFVEGEQTLSTNDMLELPKRKYARYGLNIPRREVTSLAVVAIGQMKYLEKYDSKLDSPRSVLMASRDDGKIGAEALAAAGEIFDGLDQVSKEAELHPFWERSKQMQNFILKKKA